MLKLLPLRGKDGEIFFGTFHCYRLTKDTLPRLNLCKNKFHTRYQELNQHPNPVLAAPQDVVAIHEDSVISINFLLMINHYSSPKQKPGF